MVALRSSLVSFFPGTERDNDMGITAFWDPVRRDRRGGHGNITALTGILNWFGPRTGVSFLEVVASDPRRATIHIFISPLQLALSLRY